MRLALTLFILTLGAFPGRAATGLSTPIFTNFYTPHFIVAPNATPTQIIKSRIFGTTTNITTNIFNNTVNIFTNSTIIINGTNLAGGDSLWTNRNSLYYPTVTDAQTIVFGRSAEAWWVPTLADGFVSIHDASAGDSQFNSLAIAAIDNVLQENYGQFTSTLGSGAAPAGAMQLLAATNWQNPSAPISKFSVDLQPAHGEVLLDLVNNGIHNFAVSNQITSVQSLQLVPLTNITLGIGANQINVQSNSYVALQASFSDPTTTEIDLSTGLRDGMLLLLKNIGVASGFTLFNGSPLYDDPTKYVTLSGGNWATTNYGESILLSGGLNGWSEVKRFGQDTNILTDQLWANSSGVYYPLQAQTSLLATNIFSYQTLQTYGALKLLASSGYSLVAGDNNIDPVFTSLLKLTGFDADPTSTTLHLGAGSGVGQFLYLLAVTNSLQVLNGDPLFNDPTKFVYLSNGDWKPTNRSEMLSLFETPIGWMEIGRSPGNTNTISGEFLWELFSDHMRTTGDTTNDWQFRYAGVPQLTIFTNGTINNSGFDIQNDGYLHVHGTGGFSELQLDGSSAGSMIDIYNDDNLSLIQFQSPLNGIMRTAFISPTQTEGSPGINAPYWFGTIETYTNSAIWAIFNGTNAIVNNIPSISLGPDARITFGAKSPLLYSTNTLSGWIESDSVGSVSLGFLANTNMVASSANVSIGAGALNANLVGANNTAVGYHSLYSLTNTSGNTAIGEVAGRFLTNGTDNVLIGRLAGDQLKIGNQNVYIGSLAASAGTVGRTNAIVIGYNADSMGGNTANIGDSSVTVMFLGGEVGWYKGTGDPNGDASLDSAPLGSFYSNKSGGAGTSLYVKQVAGAGGWVGK